MLLGCCRGAQPVDDMTAQHLVLHLDFVQGEEERLAPVEQRCGHCFGAGMQQSCLFENPTPSGCGHDRSHAESPVTMGEALAYVYHYMPLLRLGRLR